MAKLLLRLAKCSQPPPLAKGGSHHHSHPHPSSLSAGDEPRALRPRVPRQCRRLGHRPPWQSSSSPSRHCHARAVAAAGSPVAATAGSMGRCGHAGEKKGEEKEKEEEEEGNGDGRMTCGSLCDFGVVNRETVGVHT
uniref:Uncharacterized protein n=1 Tax=Oryza barthii TaxID=65489 RepID=A0A0D3GW93_9ORYZ